MELRRDDIARARQEGTHPILYFVYAGHGTLHRGEGAIALEDGLLTGATLFTLHGEDTPS